MEQQVLGVLEQTLSADAQSRIQAELQLNQLFLDGRTATALARITNASELELHKRQMSFALKKYVREQWSPFFQSFVGPTPTPIEIKDQVRVLVLAGTADVERKMRLVNANLVSAIAHSDWPDQWPDLMSSLLQQLTGPPDSVHGAMRVLSDFVSVDMSEDQLLPLARDLMPHLLGILGSPAVHSPATRARAVLIFRQCVMTLFTVKDEHPAAVKSAVGDILPQWVSAFKQLLARAANEDLSESNWDAIAVRVAIYQALGIIINSFPSTLDSLTSFVSLSLQDLTVLLPIYTAAFVRSDGTESAPASTEDESDVSSDLATLVSTIIDFLVQATSRKSVRVAMKSDEGRTTLLRTVEVAIRFAYMTTDDEEDWAEDPNAFIADEDDELVAYNVRNASLDLVTALVENVGTSALESLSAAFSSIGSESAQKQGEGDDDWWKGFEAALAVVGGQSEEVLDALEDKSDIMNLSSIFTDTLPGFVTMPDCPFLRGRAFVFASQFVRALPVEMAGHYVDAVIRVLETPDATVPVKVSAVKALKNFFRHLSGSINPARAAQAMVHLVSLLPHTSDSTGILVVDALDSCLMAGGEVLDAEGLKVTTDTLLSAWFDQPQDPLMSAALSDIFATFATLQNGAAYDVLVNSVMPKLSEGLMMIRTDPLSPATSSAMDFVESILGARPAELGPGLFASIAPALFDVLHVSEDRGVIQAGLHALTLVARKDVKQLLAWHDAEGTTGLNHVLMIIAKLLQPSESESGGLYVGDLTIALIRRATADLQPILPELLRAFALRLATAATATFGQSLVLPFAYLIYSQGEGVIELLESISMPAQGAQQPRHAVDVLLQAWSDNAGMFQGYWAVKASTVALARLFTVQRQSLTSTVVKGDLMITEANKDTIMTRSRAKKNPDQFQKIPFHAKALKLLLQEYMSAEKKEEQARDEGEDAETDDEDGDWEDEGAEFGGAGGRDMQFLSDMLDGNASLAKYLADEGGDQDDDEDLKDDPLYQLDLAAHLRQFFQQSYEHDTSSLRQLVEQYLTDAEKSTLARALQS